MGSKKVLFINSIVGTGSTGRIITGLCDVLNSYGVRTLVCYGRGNAPSGYDTYRIGSDWDVYLHGALCRITDRQGLYSDGATDRLIKKIKEYDPDLIHLHNIHGYYLNYEKLFTYLRSCGKRIVWTLHDCWAFTGHCTHFDYTGCEKWKVMCHDCEQLKEYPRSLFSDESEKNFMLKKRLFTHIQGMELVTPSFWLKGEAGKSFLGDYDINVIPTGIDLERFSPVKSDIRSRYGIGDRVLILGVANPWRERKGLYEFIRLAEMLDDRFRIVMIGLKPGQMKLLPSNVTGIMKTDSLDEMTAWYTAADMYVNLTLEDTFPTTNIEALACGTPVITYRAGGSPESLDETCGRVLEKNDVSGVKAAIEAFGRKDCDISDRCLLRARNYDSRKRFEEYFGKEYRL